MGANSGGSDFDTETRQAALELVITVIEGKPSYVRKDSALLAALCECHMGLLLHIEDTEAWHAAIEEQDHDDGVASLVVCSHFSHLASRFNVILSRIQWMSW